MEIRMGKLSMKTIDAEADRKSDRRKAAQKRVYDAKHVDAEDWDRIMAMKNSKTDNDRLQRTRDAMERGVIERDPADSVDKKGNVKKFSKAEALRLFAKLVVIEREATLKRMVEEMPDNYVLITEIESLREVVSVIMTMRHEPIIAVDTETTGLDTFTDVIVGFSITDPVADKHYYVPIEPTEDKRALPSNLALEAVRPLIEAEHVRKIFHNAGFDMKMFQRHGIELHGLYWDTQTAMIMLNENEMSYRLKDLATKYLKEPSDTFDELFGKDAKFNEIPLDIALVYAAKDTHITYKLYEFQLGHLERMPSVLEYFLDVEMRLIPVVVDMENAGFNIDVEFAKEYGKEMKADIERLASELMRELGDINLNSPAQLKPALEAATGEKLDSTDAKKVLKPLSKKHPVVAKLLDYKELTKLYGTYISVLPEKIHPKTGKVHVRFNPNGTVTGRFSSGGSSTNIQNQPQSARPMYVAPPGWVIVGGDFSAQEVRCAANKSQEPTLLKAFREGKDPYATLASEYYGLPYEQCYKNPDGSDTKQRKEFKVVMLAVMYGMGPGALASSLKITMDQAKKFLADFFKKYRHIDAWIKQTQANTKRDGFVWIGNQCRKRRLPDARRKTRGQYVPEVSRALRQGPNAEIQGESAIQTKKTLIALHAECKKRGWKPWATIHDENLVLMPDTLTMEDIEAFERVMVGTYQFGNVPNKTDIEIMDRWGHGMMPEHWFEKHGKGA